MLDQDQQVLPDEFEYSIVIILIILIWWELLEVNYGFILPKAWLPQNKEKSGTFTLTQGKFTFLKEVKERWNFK